MTDSPSPSPDSRSSTDIDDQFRSLMEGLRTTIPGVMVLFAFLLTLPLQQAFTEMSDADRLVFYIAFAFSAIAAVLLIAPGVHQRLRGPISGLRRHTWSHVMVATRLAIGGTVSFSLAIAAVVYLVTSLVLEAPVAGIAAGLITAVILWSWYYLPLVAFSRSQGPGRR